MAGFVVEVDMGPQTTWGGLRVVDLGGCELTGAFQAAGVRAGWCSWEGRKSLRVAHTPERFLWIEGTPDRYPREGEEATAWLAGRSGSFRGFEVELADGRAREIRAFVDPLSTRPLYHLQQDGRIYFSDKVATLAMNAPRPEVEWGGVLEAMVFGTVYSDTVTLRGAAALLPGEWVAAGEHGFRHGGINQAPPDPDLAPLEVRGDPAGALLVALRKAVRETWADLDSWLLLSGGLDSRTTLILGGPGRKSMSVTGRPNRESRLAREIAQACGAEFRHEVHPPERYYTILSEGHLLTGALQDSLSAHHLGLTERWRAAGIRSTANAFLFDTYLKGYFSPPYRYYAPASRILWEVFGAKSFGLQKSKGRSTEATVEHVAAMLTADGRDELRRQLGTLNGVLTLRVEQGLDLTLETRILSRIYRQPHYPILLSWYEGQDVASPIFHPAVLSWSGASRAVDRYRGRAFRQMLVRLNHPAVQVPDSNTGQLPEAGLPTWRSELPRRALYRGAASAWSWLRRITPKPEEEWEGQDEGSWPALYSLLNSPEGRRILEEGIAGLERVPLFDQGGLYRALEDLSRGRACLSEALAAAMTAGLWSQFVANAAKFQHESVKWIDFDGASESRR